MVIESSLLVKKETLQVLVDEHIKKESEIVEDLKRILPHAGSGLVGSSIEKRLAKGEECLKALREGFVPMDMGFFTRVDVKSKWSRDAVKEVLDSMPEEVKEVWEKAKGMGVFKTFSVTTDGGDPVLVGNAGGKHFFIAGWINFGRKVSLGIRMKL